MNKDKNIAIFADTLKQANLNYKYTGIIDNLTTEPTNSLEKINESNGPGPNVHISNDDCINLIGHKSGRGILINSASLKHPGGGVRNGSNAQEENLCRQSNLYLALEKLTYPLHNKTFGIYLPNVTFFKYGAEFKYAPLEINKEIDILMLFSRPRNVFNDEQECYNYHLNIFKSLIVFGNKYNAEYIILPPIGSGVFKNNPHTVARALKDVLYTYKLSTVKDIYIACYNNTVNYTAYNSIFSAD